MGQAENKELWKKFQGYGKIKRHKLAELILNHHLTNSHFGFFIKLLTMAHHRTGAIGTCLNELLGISGCSRKTLQKDIRVLGEKGLVGCKNPKARWKDNVSYLPGEAPYLIEIKNYHEYFEAATPRDSTCVSNTQVQECTGVDIGQVTPSTRVNPSSNHTVTLSNPNNNIPPNKHYNKHNNNHHQGGINNTCVNSTLVTDDDVLWFQEEFRKRTNNIEIDTGVCKTLLGKYGKEIISRHLMRLDFKKANNPPGLLIDSLENPNRYTCLANPSMEEKEDEKKKKDEERRKKDREKMKAMEEERVELEKRKQIWDSLDNIIRRRYIDRAREEIILENKEATGDVMNMCLMELNVSARAMGIYFRERKDLLCRI